MFVDVDAAGEQDKKNPTIKLRHLTQEISQPLTEIFNRSLQISNVHDDRKLANETQL